MPQQCILKMMKMTNFMLNIFVFHEIHMQSEDNTS